MAAPTVAVTVKLSSLIGEAIEGATVKAKLDRTDIYQQFVIADDVTGTTDENGECVLDLFPNALPTNDPAGLGSQGSVYHVTATGTGGKKLSVQAVIPNQACDLHDVIVAEEPGAPSTGEIVGAVRYNIAQTLTSPQQAQARANIGFDAAVRAVALTGLSLATATAIAATDTALVAFGKAQAQITVLDTAKANLSGAAFSGAVSATGFTGPLTGNVTGNVSGSAGSVAASAITGTTLAAGVTASSLTSVGTLTALTVSGQASFAVGSAAAPSVKVGAEQNGFYSSATNTLDVTVGGVRQVQFARAANAVNYAFVTGAPTANSVGFGAAGSDTNIGVYYTAKGTGSHDFYSRDGVNFRVGSNVSTAINFFTASGQATGTGPLLFAGGSDTNVSARYRTQGTGEHRFETGSSANYGLVIAHTVSSVNWPILSGSATGNAVTISTGGSDTNRSITFVPAGSGTVNVTGTMTATAFSGPLTGNVTGNVSGSAGSVAAANITGTTLASNVVTSSLTSLGTLTALTVSGVSSITANSASAALTVTQTGSGNAFVVEDSASDTTPFVIDAAGVVIAGHTADMGGANVFQAKDKSVGVFNYGNSAFVNGLFNSYKSRSTTPGVFSAVQSGDELGFLFFRGDDGAAWRTAAYIGAAVDGTPGASDMPGRLIFATTADGASSPTERMRIDSAGNVGIGAAPTAGYKLQIAGTASGATSTFGIFNTQAVDPAVSTAIHIDYAAANSVSAGTLPDLRCYNASQGAFTGTVTSQYGFYVQGTLTGATNNFGFYSNIASAANRWNFYAAGTAPNYFTGITYCASSVWAGSGTAIAAGGTAGVGLQVSSTANFGVFFGSGAPTLSAAKGSLYLRSDGSTTNDRMYVNSNGSTTWTAVTTVA